MIQKISFSPVTRISGLLSVDIFSDENGRVKEANVIGEQFRGFEAMMKGRQITDAVYFTQRICGICSMAHGFTAARLVEQIYGITPTPELILLQQAMLGAEFLRTISAIFTCWLCRIIWVQEHYPTPTIVSLQ